MRKSILLVQAVLLLSLPLFSQKKDKTKATVPVAVKQDNTDSVLFSRQRYRLVGPFRGGRSGAVAGSYKNRNTFYFGNTGGGVWKTSDGGSNWKNITDKGHW